nr:hypothetical protein GCM10010200_033200 [Actinomadura rugatobispora]
MVNLYDLLVSRSLSLRAATASRQHHQGADPPLLHGAARPVPFHRYQGRYTNPIAQAEKCDCTWKVEVEWLYGAVVAPDQQPSLEIGGIALEAWGQRGYGPVVQARTFRQALPCLLGRSRARMSARKPDRGPAEWLLGTATMCPIWRLSRQRRNSWSCP